MNEDEWRYCLEPTKMLDLLKERISSRKFRLIACACVRWMEPLLFDPRSRRAIEVALRHADGQASDEEMLEAELAAFEVSRAADFRDTMALPSLAASRAAGRVANLDAFTAAREAIYFFQRVRAPWEYSSLGQVLSYGDPRAIAVSNSMTCDLLREVAGYPFRPWCATTDWRCWNQGVIIEIARTIYCDERFKELPILADALEDAGCPNSEWVIHLRQPTGHVRGCWVVDQILGLN